MNNSAFSPTYLRALNALTTALNNIEVSYSISFSNFGNGFEVCFSNGAKVSINDYTDGHEIGLWESCGFSDDNGTVTGFMTVNDILNRFYIGFDNPIWYA